MERVIRIIIRTRGGTAKWPIHCKILGIDEEVKYRQLFEFKDDLYLARSRWGTSSCLAGLELIDMFCRQTKYMNKWDLTRR
jgi:hypothetical protein